MFDEVYFPNLRIFNFNLHQVKLVGLCVNIFFHLKKKGKSCTRMSFNAFLSIFWSLLYHPRTESSAQHTDWHWEYDGTIMFGRDAIQSLKIS